MGQARYRIPTPFFLLVGPENTVPHPSGGLVQAGGEIVIKRIHLGFICITDRILKIIHTDTDDLDNPQRGGQPVRTYEINSRLSLKHDVTVLTAVFSGSERRKIRDGVVYQRLGINIKPFGLSPHLTYLSCLGPKVASTPHDIVVEEFMPPFGFCFLPWWTHKPVVTIVQWYFFKYWEKQYHLPFKRWMHWIADKKRYTYFIVQTRAMGERFRRLVPDAVIRKIPCGINDEAFISDVAYGDFVLFLGRLDIWQKGLDLLLAAWQRVCTKYDIPLVIAGAGPEKTALENRIDSLGLNALVKCVGRVDGLRKKELLRTCRFMVMPSREETFGLSALEAMAAKKPVVVFNIENLNEVVCPDCGAVVHFPDTAAFAQAVSDLWIHMNTCRRMGETGRRIADGYRWGRQAEAQIAFYQEVLENTKK